MKKGFTLIELLVVVLIIGILSAVALPQYEKTVQKARTTEVKNYVDAWKKAQNIYRLENGEYSRELDDLSITMPTLKYFTVESPDPSSSGAGLRITPGSNFQIEGLDGMGVYMSQEHGYAWGCCFGASGSDKLCEKFFCTPTNTGSATRCVF